MMFAWIESFGFLRGNVAALMVLATAVFILMIPSVRLALVGLAVQYFALMLLYLDVIDPRLALVKLLVGWFVCLILMVTGQQVNWGRRDRVKPMRFGDRQVSVTAVRGLLAFVLLGIVWLLARQDFSFMTTVPNALALAVYGLVGFGLLGMFTSADELLRAGMGVLMLIAGLELYTTALSGQAQGGLVIMAAVNLFVAVLISFLTQKRYANTTTSFL
ncbi:MAG: hypothetical protein IAF02_11880 [Anaerolineae bacterium]|nr:hypothetical protein [Anaerolineae bacterium]